MHITVKPQMPWCYSMDTSPGKALSHTQLLDLKDCLQVVGRFLDPHSLARARHVSKAMASEVSWVVKEIRQTIAKDTDPLHVLLNLEKAEHAFPALACLAINLSDPLNRVPALQQVTAGLARKGQPKLTGLKLRATMSRPNLDQLRKQYQKDLRAKQRAAAGPVQQAGLLEILLDELQEDEEFPHFPVLNQQTSADGNQQTAYSQDTYLHLGCLKPLNKLQEVSVAVPAALDTLSCLEALTALSSLELFPLNKFTSDNLAPLGLLSSLKSLEVCLDDPSTMFWHSREEGYDEPEDSSGSDLLPLFHPTSMRAQEYGVVRQRYLSLVAALEPLQSLSSLTMTVNAESFLPMAQHLMTRLTSLADICIAQTGKGNAVYIVRPPATAQSGRSTDGSNPTTPGSANNTATPEASTEVRKTRYQVVASQRGSGRTLKDTVEGLLPLQVPPNSSVAVRVHNYGHTGPTRFAESVAELKAHMPLDKLELLHVTWENPQTADVACELLTKDGGLDKLHLWGPEEEHFESAQRAMVMPRNWQPTTGSEKLFDLVLHGALPQNSTRLLVPRLWQLSLRHIASSSQPHRQAEIDLGSLPPTLRVLDLNNMQLKGHVLPNGLPYLEALSLSECSIDTLGQLGYLPSLKHLFFSNDMICKQPACMLYLVWQFPALKSLSLLDAFKVVNKRSQGSSATQPTSSAGPAGSLPNEQPTSNQPLPQPAPASLTPVAASSVSPIAASTNAHAGPSQPHSHPPLDTSATLAGGQPAHVTTAAASPPAAPLETGTGPPSFPLTAQLAANSQPAGGDTASSSSVSLPGSAAAAAHPDAASLPTPGTGDLPQTHKGSPESSIAIFLLPFYASLMSTADRSLPQFKQLDRLAVPVAGAVAPLVPVLQRMPKLQDLTIQTSGVRPTLSVVSLSALTKLARLHVKSMLLPREYAQLDAPVKRTRESSSGAAPMDNSRHSSSQTQGTEVPESMMSQQHRPSSAAQPHIPSASPSSPASLPAQAITLPAQTITKFQAAGPIRAPSDNHPTSVGNEPVSATVLPAESEHSDPADAEESGTSPPPAKRRKVTHNSTDMHAASSPLPHLAVPQMLNTGAATGMEAVSAQPTSLPATSASAQLLAPSQPQAAPPPEPPVAEAPINGDGSQLATPAPNASDGHGTAKNPSTLQVIANRLGRSLSYTNFSMQITAIKVVPAPMPDDAALANHLLHALHQPAFLNHVVGQLLGMPIMMLPHPGGFMIPLGALPFPLAGAPPPFAAAPGAAANAGAANEHAPGMGHEQAGGAAGAEQNGDGQGVAEGAHDAAGQAADGQPGDGEEDSDEDEDEVDIPMGCQVM